MIRAVKTLLVRDRQAWRSWLAKNHVFASEVWLVFYKKHANKPSVGYEEAVEEALCFGWIDGLVRRLDDEKYAQRFSPRKPNSQWSESNKQRVARMLRLGKMAPAGRALVHAAKRNGQWQEGRREKNMTPEELQDALAENPAASESGGRHLSRRMNLEKVSFKRKRQRLI